MADEIHISKPREQILRPAEAGGSPLLTAIALTGFFVAIAGALQFSSWAEGWLASSASPTKQRMSDAASSPDRPPLASAREHTTVRAD